MIGLSIKKKRWPDDVYLVLIILCGILSYGRIIFFSVPFTDDNCWLLSVFMSKDITDFLNTGFFELRRVTLGLVLYPLLKIHTISDHAYLILHSLALFVQISTPCFLYLFLRNLFNKRLLALFSGLALIIFPWDLTLPVFSNINYRLGLLCGVISFFLTEKALRQDVNRSLYGAALITALTSHSIFLETIVAFEPARLLLLAYIFHKKGFGPREIVKRAMTTWLPFFCVALPLILYKLLYKPYGLYAGVYTLDPLFFMKREMHSWIIDHMLFRNWLVMFRRASHAAHLSFGLGALGMTIGLAVLKMRVWRVWLRSSNPNETMTLPHGGRPSKERNVWVWSLLFGAILLSFSVCIYEMAGQYPTAWAETRHGITIQFGYAVLMGTLMYIIYFCFAKLAKEQLYVAFLAAVCGAGIFVNNLNMDLYYVSIENQKKFWGAFVRQFPVLPEKADFLMDVNVGEPYNINLYTSYGFEFVLNMLYARTKDPYSMRNYRVITQEEWESFSDHNAAEYVRSSRFGKEKRDIIDPNSLVIIRYRDNKSRRDKSVLPNGYLSIERPPGMEKVSKPDTAGDRIYPLRQKIRGIL